MKKIIKISLTLTLILSAIPFAKTNAKANEESSYLEEFKAHYINNSFFQYTPQDLNEYYALEDDEIIAIFEGIKVTKKLLNEYLILDIEKVTLDDLVNYNSISADNSITKFTVQNDVETNALVPNIPEPGGGPIRSRRIASGYSSVETTRRVTRVSTGRLSRYEIITYLSNDDLETYIDESAVDNAVNGLCSTLVGASGTVIFTIANISLGGFGTVIELAAASIVASQTVSEIQFLQQAQQLKNNGKKAKVTLTNGYRSITEWTGDFYQYAEGTYDDFLYESFVKEYY